MSADSAIPFLPPLAASPPLEATLLTISRLITTLGTVAVTAHTDEDEAMVVFVDREPVVAVGRRGSTLTEGEGALEAIASVPIERLRLLEINPDLARAVGSYFLPTSIG